MTTTTPPEAGVDDRGAEGRTRFGAGLAVVVVLGAALRLWYLVSSRVDATPVTEQGDAFWYSTTAQNLADGELFRRFFGLAPTAEHPPLTVLVLTPASLLSSSTLGQRLTMLVLGLATIGLIGVIARRLAGPTAGLAAAAVAALSPSLWINDVLVMSESVTALAVTLVIGAGVVLAERPTTRGAALAGGLCGLAALSRAETALLLPFVVWVVLATATSLPWRRRVAMAAAATAAAALVVAPWVGLNLSRFEEPVLISTNDGLTLAGANCDTTYQGPLEGGWALSPCVLDAYDEIEAAKPPPGPGDPLSCVDSLQDPPCLDPSQVSSRLRAEGLDYATDHLDELPGVVVARNARVWGLDHVDQTLEAGEGEGRSRWAGKVELVSVWVLAPAAVAGLVLLRRRGASLAPFLGPLAVVVLITSAVTGLTPRYRLPWDVAACILAGVAVGALLDAVRGRGPGPSPAADPATKR